MNINDRSYGGKLFRPTPEIYINEDQNLFVMATPWGATEVAKDFIEILTSQFRTSMEDLDKTMTTNSGAQDFMSFEENRLRMAIIAAHEDILEKYNEETISAGVEVLCFFKSEQKVSWFVVGAPFMGLKRDDKFLPLHHPVDLSFDFSTKEKSLPPLPKNLLGVQSYISLESGSFRSQKDDEMILISRSYIPHEIFNMVNAEMTIENATLAMAKENENQPFWIGSLKFAA